MTTSGTSTGQITVGEIITAAYREMGVVGPGQEPTGNETQNAIRSLNWMLKSFSARGINLWREDQINQTVTGATLTLDASVDDVTEIYVNVSNIARPLLRYERSQYAMLPNKATPGQPSIYYADKQRDQIVLHFWPVPTNQPMTIYTVNSIDDVTDTDQTLDVPLKWVEAVYIALAARLCATAGVTRVDPGTAGQLAQRAAAMEQVLLDDDRPASIYMEPGNGGWYG